MKQPELAPSSRRERKKAAMHSKMIDVAMSLFKSQGFHDTSMEHIAEQCDVAKATLYKYFPVKEAIIAAYWQQEIQKYRAGLDQIIAKYPDTRTRLEMLLTQYMQRIMENRELYEIYIRYRLQHLPDPEANAKLRSGAEENALIIIRAGQQSGELRTDMSDRLLAGNLEMLSLMQAIIWLHHPEQFSLKSMSKMLTDLFLNGAMNHEK